MPERKAMLAGLCSFFLIIRRILPLIIYGPILEDPEYDAALSRAQEIQLPQIASAERYPFSMMLRDEGAVWFASFAQARGMSFVRDDCAFDDIATLTTGFQQAIIDGCRYGFFKGFAGGFVPHDPLSKAAAIVIITRIVMPEKAFPDVKEFRVPYMEEAVRLGILKNPEHPYLMYPISRYELLLMLWRASKY